MVHRPVSKQQTPEFAICMFSGILFEIYQWKQTLYDGSEITFEKAKRPDTIVIIPATDRNTLLLLEQEQPGRAPFISCVGGRVEGRENPLETAQRELLEETGISAEEFVLWDARHPFVKIDWVIYTFIARGLSFGKAKPEAGERIQLLEKDFDQFLDLSLSPEFTELHIVPSLLRAKFIAEEREALYAMFWPRHEY
jgi:ADP-ribose pyrophosphatase